MERKGMLDKSPPAVHQVLSLVAWPTAEDEFLLARFSNGDRVVQKIGHHTTSGKYKFNRGQKSPTLTVNEVTIFRLP